jgi:hypothetical protein
MAVVDHDLHIRSFAKIRGFLGPKRFIYLERFIDI